jgi:hypothetical protein
VLGTCSPVPGSAAAWKCLCSRMLAPMCQQGHFLPRCHSGLNVYFIIISNLFLILADSLIKVMMYWLLAGCHRRLPGPESARPCSGFSFGAAADIAHAGPLRLLPAREAGGACSGSRLRRVPCFFPACLRAAIPPEVCRLQSLSGENIVPEFSQGIRQP